MNKLIIFFCLQVLSVCFCSFGDIYPQNSFTRTFYADSQSQNTYCVTNGEFGTQQGVGYQKYMGVQPCYYGQIKAAQYNDYVQLQLGLIGSVSGSFKNLGDMQIVGMTYNVSTINRATVYNSIHWNDITSSMEIVKSVSPSDVLTFQTIDQQNYESKVNAVPGDIILFQLFSDQTVYGKLTVLEGGANPTISWTVVYGPTNTDDGSSSQGPLPPQVSYALSAFLITFFVFVGVILVVTVAVIIGIVVYLKKRSNLNYAPIATTNYQATPNPAYYK